MLDGDANKCRKLRSSLSSGQSGNQVRHLHRIARWITFNHDVGLHRNFSRHLRAEIRVLLSGQSPYRARELSLSFFFSAEAMARTLAPNCLRIQRIQRLTTGHKQPGPLTPKHRFAHGSGSTIRPIRSPSGVRKCAPSVPGRARPTPDQKLPSRSV